MQGLTHAAHDADQQHHADCRHDGEYPPPTAKGQHLSAEDGSEDRGDIYYQHKNRQGLGCVAGFEVVTYDGARNDNACGAAEGLGNAPEGEVLDAFRIAAAYRGDDENREPQNQGLLATISICK